MIFNQQGRPEALDFLNSIHEAAKQSPFTHVVFTTNLSTAEPSTSASSKRDFINNQFDPSTLSALTVQRGFAERWEAIDPNGAQVALTPSVKDALTLVRDQAEKVEQSGEVKVLVTGSLHLVGAMLGSLEDVDAL